MARRLTTNVKARPKNKSKFYSALDNPWTRGQLMVNWKFNFNSPMRVVQTKKTRTIVPSKTVVQRYMREIMRSYETSNRFKSTPYKHLFTSNEGKFKTTPKKLELQNL